MSTNNQTDAKSRTIRPWVVLSAVVALLVCSSVVQGSDVSDYDVAGDILFSGPISHSKHASVVLQPQAASSFKSPSLEHLAQSPPSPTLFELDQARHKGDSSYSHAWLRTHLGTKGPYPHENRPVGRLNDVPEGYELVQLHLVRSSLFSHVRLSSPLGDTFPWARFFLSRSFTNMCCYLCISNS